MEELIAAAESTHNANLAVADVEAAFLEGEHQQSAAHVLLLRAVLGAERAHIA